MMAIGPARRASAIVALLFVVLGCVVADASPPHADDRTHMGPDQAAMARLYREVQAAAPSHGVHTATVDRALAGLTADPEVVALMRRQPEQQLSVGGYVDRVVSDERIATGREMAVRHAATLAAIEQRYGIDRLILLAVWGIETSYGSDQGGHSVIRALATLAAHDPRRSEFWTRELIAALRIVERKGVAPEQIRGSWAGAMGHTQFMPGTYLRHAVDFDGDGWSDVWSSLPDALASTAAYLAASGWNRREPWGYEARMSAGFELASVTPATRLTMSQWTTLGVSAVASAAGSKPGDFELFRLLLPAGASGPVFLVGSGFEALLRYNQSMSYALSVGLLADRLAGGATLAVRWPSGDEALDSEEREELQRRLASLGFDPGPVDGLIGARTRMAAREFQISKGMIADGHAGSALLERLRLEGVE